MATFYLLPSRRQLGRQFGELLSNLFPGLAFEPDDWPDLGEALGAAAQCQPDVYVIFAEEVPEGMPLDEALALSFGVEPGDEIIAVRPGPRLSEVGIERRVISMAA
jgi:hypothetical protein